MDTTDMIRGLRAGAGYTQVQLAKRAGTTQSMIARYESGAVRPTVSALSRIVRACGQELTFATAAHRTYTAPAVETPVQVPRSTAGAGISYYLKRPDSGWRPGSHAGSASWTGAGPATPAWPTTRPFAPTRTSCANPRQRDRPAAQG